MGVGVGVGGSWSEPSRDASATSTLSALLFCGSYYIRGGSPIPGEMYLPHATSLVLSCCGSYLHDFL